MVSREISISSAKSPRMRFLSCIFPLLPVTPTPTLTLSAGKGARASAAGAPFSVLGGRDDTTTDGTHKDAHSAMVNPLFLGGARQGMPPICDCSC